jgi:uncharacterized membrane protein
MEKASNKRYIHIFFEFGIFAKGFNAAIEIIAGFFLLFISQNRLIKWAVSLTYEELSEDPRDFVANYLLKSAENLSIGGKEFGAFYLLSHGIVKIFLVISLLQKKSWAYPAAMVIFALFIVYQLYRFTYNHSPIMIALSAFDLLVIVATWFEYKNIQRSGAGLS